MENKDKSKELKEKGIFSFVNQGCEVQEIEDFDEYGKPRFFLNLKENGTSVYFVFRAGDGLVREDTVEKKIKIREGYPDEDEKTIIEKKLIGVFDEFLDMKMDNTMYIEKYFRDNGYLFSLQNEAKYTRIPLSDIKQMQYSMKLLREVAQLALKNQEKSQLLEKMSELLLNKGNHIDSGSYIHPFTKMLLSDDLENDSFTETTIDDTFLGKEEIVYGDQDPSYWYDERIEEIEKPHFPYWFRKKVFDLYIKTGQNDKNTRYVVDFFYHIFDKFKDQLFLTESEYGYKITGDIDNNEKFDDHFQEALVKVAKIVVKEELDFAIRNTQNIVDLETLKPDLYIPDLYTALYMAMFHSRKYDVNPRIVKYCEKCGKMFTVKNSASRKKFCSTKCKNAASQTKWREKHKHS